MGFFNGLPLESQGSFTSRFLVQLIIILGLPRVLYVGLQYTLQPRVVSEILSGIILGPTVFGLIPGYTELLFPYRSLSYLNSLAQLGMIMYLFMVGMSLSLEQIIENRRITFGALVLGNGIPFVASFAVAFLFMDEHYSNANYLEMVILISILIIGAALTVLARILNERNMMRSILGAVTMSTTALDTFLAWLMFSTVLSLYGARVDWVRPNVCPDIVVISPIDSNSKLTPIFIFLCYIGLILAILFPVRRVMGILSERTENKGRLEMATFVFVMMIVCAIAYVSQTLTVSGMLGGFTFGLLGVPRGGIFIQEIKRTLEGLITGVFLPVFFAVSGLRTNFTLLSGKEVGLAFFLVFITWITKFVGCVLASFALGMRGFKGIYYGILLTGKGLSILAILNIAMDVGFVKKVMFSMMVLFTVVSILLVSPMVALFQYLERKYNERYSPMEKPAAGDENKNIRHVLLHPSAFHLAEPVGILGAWVTSFYPESAGCALRIDGNEMELSAIQNIIARKVLAQSDPLLNPIFRVWQNYVWGGGSPRKLTSDSISLGRYPSIIFSDFLNGDSSYRKKKKGTVYDTVVFGYDHTEESRILVDTALKLPEKTVILLSGPASLSFIFMNKVLIISDGSSHNCDEFFVIYPALLRQYPNCVFYWWEPSGKVPVASENSIQVKGFEPNKHSSINEVLESFSTLPSFLSSASSPSASLSSSSAVYPPDDTPISLILCPIDADNYNETLAAARYSSVPVIFIRPGKERVASFTDEPPSDFVVEAA